MEELVFTPGALLDILRQIDELNDKEISVVETTGGRIQIQIGESAYTIDTQSAVDVQVPDKVVEDVSDVNDEAYQDMQESGVEFEEFETVESGLIKEIAKTLLIGGMVRLTNKLLGKDRDKDKLSKR